MPTTTDERARTVCPACEGWGMLADGDVCHDCDQRGWVWRPAGLPWWQAFGGWGLVLGPTDEGVRR